MQTGPVGSDISMNDIVDQSGDGGVFLLVFRPCDQGLILLIQIAGRDIHVDIRLVFIIIIQSSL